MLIARSPLRISLGGGGTDLPSYYRDHGGYVIAGAIDKYVYITVHRTFVPDMIIKYSSLERVSDLESIEHPIIRETLRLLNWKDFSIEITSMADIPAGTGLGSSGSFTTALFKALHAYQNHTISPRDLAEQACEIELEKLTQPVGKQDQYIAAHGGISCFEFNTDDTVTVSPLQVSEETLYNLEDDLLLFFTGYSRSASSILKEQDDRSKAQDARMVDNLHFIKDLGRQSKVALESGNLQGFGRLMDVHWKHKRERSVDMTNGSIDAWYDLARHNGAVGGKLIGAGGGGFLMFYAEDKGRLRHTMRQAGLEEVRFRFDFTGSCMVAS
ncbi:GHMP kinase [soil metagenome]